MGSSQHLIALTEERHTNPEYMLHCPARAKQQSAQQVARELYELF